MDLREGTVFANQEGSNNNHYNHPRANLLNNGAGYVRGRQSRSLLPVGDHGKSCCLVLHNPRFLSQ